jgi:hypothetical protein
MSDVTRLLDAAASGDRQAAADLLPLVYTELRELAAARLAGEFPGQTLDATELVHEAYLRLVGDQRFDGHGHFFAAAAEAMRLLLAGYGGLRQREEGIPSRASTRIPEAIDRLIELYTATNKPGEATKWRAERAKYPAAAPMTSTKE